MRSVIFDFDGTIADSFSYVYGFLAQAAHRPSSPTQAELLKLKGVSMKSIALGLGLPRWRLPLLYFQGRRALKKTASQMQPFPHITEAIEQLHCGGFHLSIVSSNATETIEAFLQAHNLGNYFSHIHGGASVFGKAPAIRRILRKNNLEPDNCWYIGDEVSDMVAAKSARVHALAVSWGFSDAKALQKVADVCVSSPSEIPKAVGL